MELDELFEKKIVFITGKGGVGKTTISAALAFAAAKKGKKVCLVEVDRSPNLRYIFNREIPVYRETRVFENVTVLTLDPFKSLEEYIGLQLRFPGAAKMIMNNRIVSYFMHAAPGWREFITVGKIWDMQDHTSKKNKPFYDLIIVDAPATGHGLSFLKVPSVFLNLIRFGRMQGQIVDVQKMITDRKRTALCVVTLPEEMPVNEAIMILESAGTGLDMQTGPTFVNGMRPPIMDEEERLNLNKLLEDENAMKVLGELCPDRGKALFKAEKDQEMREKLDKSYLELVRRKIGPPIITIPHIYPGRVDLPGVTELAEIINQTTSGLN